MSELQNQLAELRRRMASAAARADEAVAAAATARLQLPLITVEDYIDGKLVETAFGTHFEHERVWEPKRRPGSSLSVQTSLV